MKHGLDPQEAQLKAGMSPSAPEFGADPQDGTLTYADGTSERITLRGQLPRLL